MRRLLLIMLLAAAAAAEAQVPAQSAPQAPPTLPKQLTLAQALDIALANNTNIREAQAKFDQAAGQTEKSKEAMSRPAEYPQTCLLRRPVGLAAAP